MHSVTCHREPGHRHQLPEKKEKEKVTDCICQERKEREIRTNAESYANIMIQNITYFVLYNIWYIEMCNFDIVYM